MESYCLTQGRENCVGSNSQSPLVSFSRLIWRSIIMGGCNQLRSAPCWSRGHTLLTKLSVKKVRTMGEGPGHGSRPLDPGHYNALFRAGDKSGWQKMKHPYKNH